MNEVRLRNFWFSEQYIHFSHKFFNIHFGSYINWTDFFDQFEQTTQGENFRHPSMPNTNEDAKMMGNTDTSASATDNNKDDLDAFMDEFERTTQGENVRRPI